ncbi:uncharacterized protein J7T54_000858 [Emericellopsis cladophorae]|uniref:Uncharacterized protein n=1 Tax=Emericellopsis cladophorae TaxID=2686198 RepID=A0A9P9Y419_9HYPO|nr:uncharacterized protein J7T54_000858 [Emericellopsis cladophorae]KAI6782715.1 hypothetical protein J7T54_000858 [Emericellopsis cladophorae]
MISAAQFVLVNAQFLTSTRPALSRVAPIAAPLISSTSNAASTDVAFEPRIANLEVHASEVEDRSAVGSEHKVDDNLCSNLECRGHHDAGEEEVERRAAWEFFFEKNPEYYWDEDEYQILKKENSHKHRPAPQALPPPQHHNPTPPQYSNPALAQAPVHPDKQDGDDFVVVIPKDKTKGEALMVPAGEYNDYLSKNPQYRPQPQGAGQQMQQNMPYQEQPQAQSQQRVPQAQPYRSQHPQGQPRHGHYHIPQAHGKAPVQQPHYPVGSYRPQKHQKRRVRPSPYKFPKTPEALAFTRAYREDIRQNGRVKPKPEDQLKEEEEEEDESEAEADLNHPIVDQSPEYDQGSQIQELAQLAIANEGDESQEPYADEGYVDGAGEYYDPHNEEVDDYVEDLPAGGVPEPWSNDVEPSPNTGAGWKLAPFRPNFEIPGIQSPFDAFRAHANGEGLVSDEKLAKMKAAAEERKAAEAAAKQKQNVVQEQNQQSKPTQKQPMLSGPEKLEEMKAVAEKQKAAKIAKAQKQAQADKEMQKQQQKQQQKQPQADQQLKQQRKHQLRSIAAPKLVAGQNRRRVLFEDEDWQTSHGARHHVWRDSKAVNLRVNANSYLSPGLCVSLSVELRINLSRNPKNYLDRNLVLENRNNGSSLLSDRSSDWSSGRSLKG